MMYAVIQIRARNELTTELSLKIPDTKLHLITVSDDEDAQLEWSWFEDRKEFKFKGMMYDVVRTVKVADFTLYYCISDLEETKLSEALEHFVSRQNSQAKKIKGIYKTFKKSFCLSDSLRPYLQVATSVIVFISTSVNNEHLELYYDIIVQPPKLV